MPPKLSLAPKRGLQYLSLKITPAVRVIARQSRDRNCLVATFDSRHQDASSGPLGLVSLNTCSDSIVKYCCCCCGHACGFSLWEKWNFVKLHLILRVQTCDKVPVKTFRPLTRAHFSGISNSLFVWLFVLELKLSGRFRAAEMPRQRFHRVSCSYRVIHCKMGYRTGMPVWIWVARGYRIILGSANLPEKGIARKNYIYIYICMLWSYHLVQDWPLGE